MAKTVEKPVTAEEFIRAWQTSESVDEVAEKIKQDRQNIFSRAHFYRKNGVVLKSMKTGRPKNDWKALRELAESLNHQPKEN